jgi:hypothetical protein
MARRPAEWVRENGLTLALLAMFATALTAEVIAGRGELNQALEREPAPSFSEYVSSSKFWFQTAQNWQSEFFGIATMVWLSVYLRQ